MDIFEALRARGFRGKGLAHVMSWFGEPNHTHRDNAYYSGDPAIISKQCELMCSVGIQGAIVTWQGAKVNPYIHQAALGMQKECAQREMLFGLLLDPWLVKNQASPTTEVITQLKAWPASTAYFPEKYVLDFLEPASMVDWPKVGIATGMNILHKHSGYSWPEISNTVAQLKTDDIQGTMKIPAICLGFNDAGRLVSNVTRDYSQSVWGGPARVIDHQAGNFWMDQVEVTPVTAQYAAVVSWNDYDEGTGIEQFVAALKGIRLR